MGKGSAFPERDEHGHPGKRLIVHARLLGESAHARYSVFLLEDVPLLATSAAAVARGSSAGSVATNASRAARSSAEMAISNASSRRLRFSAFSQQLRFAHR